jgi:hypothetical protein
MKPTKRETFAQAASLVRTQVESGLPPQDERPDFMCSAHGCPMWGSISDGQRWCRFHFGEGGKHLDAITTALRRNRPLVDSVQRLRARCASHDATPGDRPAMIEAENALALAVKAARTF